MLGKNGSALDIDYYTAPRSKSTLPKWTILPLGFFLAVVLAAILLPGKFSWNQNEVIPQNPNRAVSYVQGRDIVVGILCYSVCSFRAWYSQGSQHAHVTHERVVCSHTCRPR
jgi:hypothetical protein